MLTKSILVSVATMINLLLSSSFTYSSSPEGPKDPIVVEHSGGISSDASADISISVEGRSASPVAGRKGTDSSNVSSAPSGPPDPCFYLPQSAAEATAAGYDASKGTLSTALCPVRLDLPLLPDALLLYAPNAVWTVNGAAPVAPPPPDPAVLAHSVASELTVPAPVLHVGSPGERVAVKVPVWLWADEQPPLTASVSAGGLTVTARAVLTSMDWSMGEPVGNPDEGGAGRVASFSCSGAGVAPPVGVGRSVVPPCGYTFVWRSDAARTGGGGAWPVGVVAHWTMTWQATNGAQGTIALQAAAATQVTVGEWRVALVDGGGTH